jgi:GAF domain-containing protein
LAFGGNVPRTAFVLAGEALSGHPARLPETAVEVVLPLAVGESSIGAIDMHITDLSRFYQQSLDPLAIMADQLAVAISALRRLRQSRSALQAEREYYGRISRDGWRRMLVSGTLPGYRLQDRRVVPIGDVVYPEMRTALTRDERVVTTAAESSGASEGSGQEMDDGAVVAVPLRVRGQTIGALRIRKRRGTGSWNARELALLDSLTGQLESALESARLYRETQQAAIQQQTIAEVSAHIREEVDIESVLARALEELGGALGADQGAALLTLADAEEETA